MNPCVPAASTTILGVHLDTDARKSLPLPPELRERACAWTAPQDVRASEDVPSETTVR